MYMLYCIRKYIKMQLKEPTIEQLKDKINKDKINKDKINKEIEDVYNCYLCEKDGYLLWGTCHLCGSYNSY